MTPTLIMTRPSGQGTAFVAAVRQAWAQPLHIIDSPLLEIQHTAIDVGQVDGVIFTSVNGVVGASGLTGLQAWCVGAKTAAAARAAGFKAIAGPGDADG
ncbi:MAG: uroporphyrinogen-III synthase, partial [Pseudomonadota bacterium]